MSRTVKKPDNSKPELPASTTQSTSTNGSDNPPASTDRDTIMTNLNEKGKDSDSDDDDSNKNKMRDVGSDAESDESESESESQQQTERKNDYSDDGNAKQAGKPVAMEIQEVPGVHSDFNEEDPRHPRQQKLPKSKNEGNEPDDEEETDHEDEEEPEILDFPDTKQIFVSAFTDLFPKQNEKKQAWTGVYLITETMSTKDLLDMVNADSGMGFTKVISKEKGVLRDTVNIWNEAKEVDIVDEQRQELMNAQEWDNRPDFFLCKNNVSV